MSDLVIWLFKAPLKLDLHGSVYIYGCIIFLLLAGVYIGNNWEERFSFKHNDDSISSLILFGIAAAVFLWPIVVLALYWGFLAFFIPVSVVYCTLKRKAYKESLKKKMHEALG